MSAKVLTLLVLVLCQGKSLLVVFDLMFIMSAKVLNIRMLNYNASIQRS